jgi:hypothetical protein
MPTSQIIEKQFDKLKFGVYINESENYYFMGNPYYHRFLKIKKLQD